ncbi:unnamed protein product, partial [Discosporangium mesarthrocarpum]
FYTGLNLCARDLVAVQINFNRVRSAISPECSLISVRENDTLYVYQLDRDPQDPPLTPPQAVTPNPTFPASSPTDGRDLDGYKYTDVNLSASPVLSTPPPSM